MREPIESVLIADDDELTLSAFRTFLPRRGIRAHTATNRAAALALAREHRPQVAFVDLQLGHENGLDLLRDLKSEVPQTRSFLMTGYSSVRSTVEAMRLGAVNVLTKPLYATEVMKYLDPAWQPDPIASVETPSAEQALWEHVHRVLYDCGGNKSEAARRLKKPRSWLRRFLARPAPITSAHHDDGHDDTVE